MNDKKDPFGFKSMTRIEVIEAHDLKNETREQRRIRRERKAQAQNKFMSTIQDARERLGEIAAHLDEHLGFAPADINFNSLGVAQSLLNHLDGALTIAEQVDDLNQALAQADKDNPARR